MPGREPLHAGRGRCRSPSPHASRAVEHDVRGLQVPVDTLVVRVASATPWSQLPAAIQAALPVQPSPERPPEQLHDEVGVGPTRPVEDANDVGVMEGAAEPPSQEALAELGIVQEPGERPLEETFSTRAPPRRRPPCPLPMRRTRRIYPLNATESLLGPGPLRMPGADGGAPGPRAPWAASRHPEPQAEQEGQGPRGRGIGPSGSGAGVPKPDDAAARASNASRVPACRPADQPMAFRGNGPGAGRRHGVSRKRPVSIRSARPARRR
jgi:hypothetical protein